ncbi:MAG: peptidyl-prolyl cis-trans isomerase [Deltaproteobacteria bacterium]|nr:peptidyl-prolyl cis-trans isomerase [Deltaproteobacteria bacterium]
MKRLIKIYHFLFILIFFVSACGAPAKEDPVARVSGEPILVEDLLQSIHRESYKYGPEALKDQVRFQRMKESLLDDLIQKKILFKEAVKEGIQVSEEQLEKEIKKLKSRYTEMAFQHMLEDRKIDYQVWRENKRAHLMAEQLIQKKLFDQIKIPEEKMKEYYNQHLEEFTQPESVHVRQIVTDNKGSAEAIIKELKKGENFAMLARDLSISPDRLQGGDIGFITRGNYPKEFEICFDLKVGELSSVVQSLYGFHVFKVLEKQPEKRLSFEEVKGQIESWLQEQERDEAFHRYYEELKKAYPVKIEKRTLKRIQL